MALNKNKKTILWFLGITVAAIYGYNIALIIPRLMPAKKIPAPPASAVPEAAAVKFASKKIPYQEMNPRNIFLPPNFKRRERPKAAPAPRPANIYELNGIIPDSHNPTAILVNTKTKNTIIARKGHLLDDGQTKLSEIKDNLVIIERDGEKEELRIKH